MPSYAHSVPGAPWEPLFTPLGSGPGQCGGANCQECERLSADHGHLNKVAYWAATFAAAMFPPGPDRDAAWQWGYLAGLWHDLGKFPPEWQAYLRSKADPHLGDVSGKMDHSTAGARHAVRTDEVFGHLIAYVIAGHHSGLLDGRSNDACQASRLAKPCSHDAEDIPLDIISPSLSKPPPRRDLR